MVDKKSKNLVDTEDDDDSGGRGGGIKRKGEGNPSIMVEETLAMESQRRLEEQKGHRRYARVNQRERRFDEPEPGNQLEHQMGGPKEHPFLKSQRFDGIDPSLNPMPEIGTDARREFDNEKREQEKEKQLRLGNELKFGKSFNPEFKP